MPRIGGEVGRKGVTENGHEHSWRDKNTPKLGCGYGCTTP